MSVNPGWSAQSFIPASLDKLARMRKALPDHVALEVDGGIHENTARPLRRREPTCSWRGRRCSAPRTRPRAIAGSSRPRGNREPASPLAAPHGGWPSMAGLLLAGCGGSSAVKPSAYVKSLCTALGNWKNTIQSAGVALQSSGAAAAARPIAKADYQRFVTALVTATRKADGAVKSAGVPDVSGGKALANKLSGAFDTATQRLSQAEAHAKAISTDSAASFQAGASAVTAEIKAALGAIAAVAPGRSAQLRQAAAKEPSCQALQG